MPSHPIRRNALLWCSPLVAAAVYVLMWLGYRQGWVWLDAVDSSVLTAGHGVGVKHPGWVRFWDVVCTVFAPSTFRLLGVLAAVVALVKRRLRAALFVLVAVEPCGLVTQLAKGLVDRPRPVTALVAASSSSFPSGHALAAMVGVAALLAVTLPVLVVRVKLAAVVLGALIVVAVGVGRVALNVHHPSDVLAGWALGYLYFLGCARLLRSPGGAPAVDLPRPEPENDLDDASTGGPGRHACLFQTGLQRRCDIRHAVEQPEDPHS
ncbi:MAG TPA: phosphatase PAP2 family protein [Mycobacterium sp.]|nr:phosphatase PAP2 family protein [Mycobacterium sp.]